LKHTSLPSEPPLALFLISTSPGFKNYQLILSRSFDIRRSLGVEFHLFQLLPQSCQGPYRTAQVKKVVPEVTRANCHYFKRSSTPRKQFWARSDSGILTSSYFPLSASAISGATETVLMPLSRVSVARTELHSGAVELEQSRAREHSVYCRQIDSPRPLLAKERDCCSHGAASGDHVIDDNHIPSQDINLFLAPWRPRCQRASSSGGNRNPRPKAPLPSWPWPLRPCRGDTIAGLEDLVLAGIAEVGYDQRDLSVPIDIKELQQISLMLALSPKRSTIRRRPRYWHPCR